MRRAFLKRRRLRLKAQDYDALRLEILRRDGWRCQLCGHRNNLEVHHTQFRSHLGADSESNLITLCKCCHSSFHQKLGSSD